MSFCDWYLLRFIVTSNKQGKNLLISQGENWDYNNDNINIPLRAD